MNRFVVSILLCVLFLESRGVQTVITAWRAVLVLDVSRHHVRDELRK